MDGPKVKRPCRPEPKTIVPNALCLRKPQYQNFNVNEERDTLRKGLLGLCLSVEIWSQLRHFHQLYFSVSYTTPFLCGLLILFSSIFYLLANLASTLLFKVQFPFQCIYCFHLNTYCLFHLKIQSLSSCVQLFTPCVPNFQLSCGISFFCILVFIISLFSFFCHLGFHYYFSYKPMVSLLGSITVLCFL